MKSSAVASIHLSWLRSVMVRSWCVFTGHDLGQPRLWYCTFDCFHRSRPIFSNRICCMSLRGWLACSGFFWLVLFDGKTHKFSRVTGSAPMLKIVKANIRRSWKIATGFPIYPYKFASDCMTPEFLKWPYRFSSPRALTTLELCCREHKVHWSNFIWVFYSFWGGLSGVFVHMC